MDSLHDETDEDEMSLRLSDDEEVDPETSRSTESLQASLQPKHKDLGPDKCTPGASEKSAQNHLKIETISSVNIVKIETLSTDTPEEKVTEKICKLNEESTMSESDKVSSSPLVQKSPEHWSNCFEKRWNGLKRQCPDADSSSVNHKNFKNNLPCCNNNQNHSSKNCNNQSREEIEDDCSNRKFSIVYNSIKPNGISNNLQSIIDECFENKELKLSKSKSEYPRKSSAETDLNTLDDKKSDNASNAHKNGDLNSYNNLESANDPCEEQFVVNNEDCNISSKTHSSTTSVDLSNINAENKNAKESNSAHCDIKQNEPLQTNKKHSISVENSDHGASSETKECDNSTLDVNKSRISQSDSSDNTCEPVNMDSSNNIGDTEMAALINDEKSIPETTMIQHYEKSEDPHGVVINIEEIVQISENTKNNEHINEESVENCSDEKELSESENNDTEEITIPEIEATDNEPPISPVEVSDGAEKLSNFESDYTSAMTLSLTMTDGKSSDSYDSGLADDKNEKTSTESVSGLFDEKNNSHFDENKKQLSPTEDNDEELDKITIEEVDLLDEEEESNSQSIESTATDDSFNFRKKLAVSEPLSTIENKKTDLNKKEQKENANHSIDIDESSLLKENDESSNLCSSRQTSETNRSNISKSDEDDDEDSSDGSSNMIEEDYKKSLTILKLSLPPSLTKRTLEDTDTEPPMKKMKPDLDISALSAKPIEEISSIEVRRIVKKISQEDVRKKLKKLTPTEMEALLIQKVVECITVRGELGKLRDQVVESKRSHEATRSKYKQLQKQVEAFDLVIKRMNIDKANNDNKYVPPIKVHRSVGLQVNLVSNVEEYNNQYLKQGNPRKSALNNTPSPKLKSPQVVQDIRHSNQSPRKVLKTRSPRLPPAVTSNPTQTVATVTPSAPQPVPTPAVSVKSPAAESSPNNRTLTVQQVIIGPSSNNNKGNQNGAQKNNASMNNNANDLIDLTDDEDKNKSSVVTPITPMTGSRFSRVLQAVPGNVTLSSANGTNVRLVQANGQAAQTIVTSNNISNSNAPRLAYVMQNGPSGVPTRQLVLTTNNSIRPVTTITTKNIPGLTYKGVPALPNGAVKILATQTSGNLQLIKHPAPLPETPLQDPNPSLKLPPPAPSLKISKVTTGIVLSWNMTLTEKFAEIVSYQLYAYQELTNSAPNAALWKKVGDVRALPLPMACTLTQFTEGNNYHFAVRAVDTHSRLGQFSKPGNISL